MKQRFGDHTLPETHRVQLQKMRRKSEESIQEFSSRINSLMNKAYPGLTDEQLKAELAIRHLLNKLNGQSIAYDVVTKMPKTVQSAVDMITWHECCKKECGEEKSKYRYNARMSSMSSMMLLMQGGSSS